MIADRHIIRAHQMQLPGVDDHHLSTGHVVDCPTHIDPQLSLPHINHFQFIMPVDRHLKTVAEIGNGIMGIGIFGGSMAFAFPQHVVHNDTSFLYIFHCSIKRK